MTPNGDASSVDRGGWLAADSVPLLQSALSALKAGVLKDASVALKKIRYQTVPLPKVLDAWAAEYRAEAVLLGHQTNGFSATAAVPGIVDASLSLVRLGVDVSAWSDAMVDGRVGQWHALPGLLATPRTTRHDVQWVLYWALMPTAQRFAERLATTKPHEEHLTGRLVGAIEEKLLAVSNRIDQLGYPSTTMVLSTITIGGKWPETVTGADLGIVVRIHVGDLVVHKVALLQCKYSSNGVADVGSKPTGKPARTQLQKLTSAQRDFYLFYHHGVRNSPAMLSTVTPVEKLIAGHQWTANDLAQQSLSADAWHHGWDLSSYLAFGLADADSGVGMSLLATDDPLDALMAHGRVTLPDYLLVIVLGDSEHALEYVQKLEARAKPPRQHARGPKPGRANTKNGPEPDEPQH